MNMADIIKNLDPEVRKVLARAIEQEDETEDEDEDNCIECFEDCLNCDYADECKDYGLYGNDDDCDGDCENCMCGCNCGDDEDEDENDEDETEDNSTMNQQNYKDMLNKIMGQWKNLIPVNVKDMFSAQNLAELAKQGKGIGGIGCVIDIKDAKKILDMLNNAKENEKEESSMSSAPTPKKQNYIKVRMTNKNYDQINNLSLTEDQFRLLTMLNEGDWLDKDVVIQEVDNEFYEVI